MSDNWLGNTASSTSKSLEKRAKMRPVGVVSKNLSGALKMPDKIVRCMATDASRQPNRIASFEVKEANPVRALLEGKR